MNSPFCQLWMGSLEPYMSESFILNAFNKLGEKPLSVKIMKNKLTGEQAGYCFVHFANDEDAKTVMHKLNGKLIPGTSSRFKLNSAGSSFTRTFATEKEYSLWVGDLSSEIDDYTLYKCFAAKFPSLRSAKVVLDNEGLSKGYAFLRFGTEDEQRRCCTEMNGYKHLGSRTIKVSSAVPKSWKSKEGTPSSTQGYETTDPMTLLPAVATPTQQTTPYYDSSMWQGYASWQAYYDSVQEQSVVGQPVNENNDLELVEHDTHTNVDELNYDLLMRDLDFWDTLESSKWLPLEAA